MRHLNDLDPTTLVSESDAAAILGCTKFCLRSWRTKKTGVPYVRVGRLCRYQVSDLQKFVAANRVNPSDGGNSQIQ